MSSQRVISRRDNKKQLGMSHDCFADENANNSICQNYLDPQAHQRPDAMISNQAMSSLHPMQRVRLRHQTLQSSEILTTSPVIRALHSPSTAISKSTFYARVQSLGYLGWMMFGPTSDAANWVWKFSGCQGSPDYLTWECSNLLTQRCQHYLPEHRPDSS